MIRCGAKFSLNAADGIKNNDLDERVEQVTDYFNINYYGDGQNCPICIEPVTDIVENGPPVLLKCFEGIFHGYHTTCLKTWLDGNHDTCSIDRKAVDFVWLRTHFPSFFNNEIPHESADAEIEELRKRLFDIKGRMEILYDKRQPLERQLYEENLRDTELHLKGWDLKMERAKEVDLQRENPWTFNPRRIDEFDKEIERVRAEFNTEVIEALKSETTKLRHEWYSEREEVVRLKSRIAYLHDVKNEKQARLPIVLDNFFGVDAYRYDTQNHLPSVLDKFFDVDVQ